MHRHLLNSSLEQGRVEGRIEGRIEGLIVAVRSVSEIFGIRIDVVKEQQLASLTCEQLAALVALNS